MKAILILTGTHGSGKTKWVKDNGYNELSLSKNKLRFMLFGVTFNMNNNFWTYDKQKDRITHEEFLRIFEMRLRTGGFIIIDSTITRPKSFNVIESLAKKYGYTVYIKIFHPSLEECLANNKYRDNSYEQVSEELVKKKWEQMDNILIPQLHNRFPNNIISSVDEIGWNAMSYLYPSSGDKVHFIGDIHGDIVSLEKFLDEHWNNEDNFVFLGDYIDRGGNNREVLERMIDLCQKPNVTVLEGNHELHLWCWSYDRPIVSGEFSTNTKPELEINSDLKMKVRILLNKLKLYVTLPDYKIIACHGGISCPLLTKEYGMKYLVLDQGSFIRGHRHPIDKSEESDREFSKRSDGWVHIHGHRNNMENAPMNPFSNVYNVDQYNNRIRVVTYDIKESKYDTREY